MDLAKYFKIFPNAKGFSTFSNYVKFGEAVTQLHLFVQPPSLRMRAMTRGVGGGGRCSNSCSGMIHKWHKWRMESNRF